MYSTVLRMEIWFIYDTIVTEIRGAVRSITPDVFRARIARHTRQSGQILYSQ